MRLRNKKTGEIVSASNIAVGMGDDGGWYNSIAELTEEWEDVPEEPKEYWCIDWTGGVNKIIPLDSSHDKYEQNKKEIGNYFETEEEAEKAVEKLKAWQRLKDKGFRFEGWFGGSKDISYRLGAWVDKDIAKDLDLLFSGEDD